MTQSRPCCSTSSTEGAEVLAADMFMSRTEIRVIRPLAYIEERRISLGSKAGTSVTSSCCPYSSDTRLSAKNLLKEMEKEMPELKTT